MPRGDASRRRMRTHRAAVFATCLAGLLCLSGASCQSLRRPIDDFAHLPPALPPTPTLDQVIQAVNGNCSQIRTVWAPQASISGPGFPTLQATVAYERPLRLRVRAGTGILGEELDLGSNDELFWFWARRSQPPALYFCRHGWRQAQRNDARRRLIRQYEAMDAHVEKRFRDLFWRLHRHLQEIMV